MLYKFKTCLCISSKSLREERKGDRGRRGEKERRGEEGREEAERVRRIGESELSDGFIDVYKDGVVISSEHIQKALEQLRSSHSDAIGAPKVSSTHQSPMMSCAVHSLDPVCQLGGCWRAGGGKERDT